MGELFSTPRLADESRIFEDASLLAAAVPAGKAAGPRRHTKKSGLETAIFSAIAEGDENITAVYQTMTVDGLTGLPVLTKEMVWAVTRRAEVDMKRVEKDLLCAESISLCFLLDTHDTRDAVIQKYELPDSIKTFFSYERFTSSTTDAKIKIADDPFAKGSVRLAYYGIQHNRLNGIMTYFQYQFVFLNV